MAFGEALKPEFKEYMQRVVDSASALASVMMARGCDIVSGGTENHLMLVDLRPLGVTGKDAEAALERAGFTCNKNSVPGDPEKPTITAASVWAPPPGAAVALARKNSGGSAI